MEDQSDKVISTSPFVILFVPDKVEVKCVDIFWIIQIILSEKKTYKRVNPEYQEYNQISEYNQETEYEVVMVEVSSSDIDKSEGENLHMNNHKSSDQD